MDDHSPGGVTARPTRGAGISLASLIRSRLARKMALVVFAAILLVEVVILLPSHAKREGALLEGLRQMATQWVLAGERVYDQTDDLAAYAVAVLEAPLVTGILIVDERGEALVWAGEEIERDGTVEAAARHRRRSAGGDRFEAAWVAPEAPDTYTTVLRLDSAGVVEELRAYVWRIAGLVLIISLVLTLSTLVAMGGVVLRPLVGLRDALAVGGVDGWAAGLGRDMERRDEIGEVFRATQRLLTQVGESQRQLESRVAARTAELSELNHRLQDSETRFRDFAAASTDYFWEMDEEIRFSYLSENYTNLTGVPVAELLGKTREECFVPEVDPEVWRAHVADLRAHRPFRNFVLPRRRSDGTMVYLAIDGSPVFDADGNFAGYRGTGTDITRAREYEGALERSEELLRTLFDSASIGILHQAPDGQTRLAVNQAFCEMTGYTEAELLAEPYRTVTHPDDLAAATARRERYARGEIDGDVGEFRIVRKNGAVGWVSRSITALRNPDGEVERFVSFVLDITERKRAEAELAEKERHLSTALGTMQEGICLIDADYRVLTFNDRYRELIGVDPDLLYVGGQLDGIVRSLAEQGAYGDGDIDKLVADRLERLRDGVYDEREITMPSGRVLQARKALTEGGGGVITLT